MLAERYLPEVRLRRAPSASQLSSSTTHVWNRELGPCSLHVPIDRDSLTVASGQGIRLSSCFTLNVCALLYALGLQILSCREWAHCQTASTKASLCPAYHAGRRQIVHSLTRRISVVRKYLDSVVPCFLQPSGQAAFLFICLLYPHCDCWWSLSTFPK